MSEVYPEGKVRGGTPDESVPWAPFNDIDLKFSSSIYLVQKTSSHQLPCSKVQCVVYKRDNLSHTTATKIERDGNE